MVNPELTGQLIQKFRIKKGLTQETLSGLAGLNRSHYNMVEHGQRLPTLDTLFKIAYALDIPPHVIVEAIEKEAADEF